MSICQKVVDESGSWEELFGRYLLHMYICGKEKGIVEIVYRVHQCVLFNMF